MLLYFIPIILVYLTTPISVALLHVLGALPSSRLSRLLRVLRLEFPFDHIQRCMSCTSWWLCFLLGLLLWPPLPLYFVMVHITVSLIISAFAPRLYVLLHKIFFY